MMLKFLTHKLRTQSLNDQQPYIYKNEEEHDSGTESDGEVEEHDSIMESDSVPASPASSTSPDIVLNGGACDPPAVPPIAVSPYFLDSALPSDSDQNYDHHSSEEELEVINSHVNIQQHRHHHHHHHRKHHRHHQQKEHHHNTVTAAAIAAALCGDSAATPTAGASIENNDSRSPMSSNCLREKINNNNNTTTTTHTAYPEKRKWSQVGSHVSCSSPSSSSRVDSGSSSSGSSDEEVQGLMAMATPVEFRTSPPLNAHKPGQTKPIVRSLSPPSKLFHYSPTLLTTSASASAIEVSPSRKRHHKGPRAHHIQRPCLDFEKMQQLKARAVTAWRHNGEHGGGELSLFCW